MRPADTHYRALAKPHLRADSWLSGAPSAVVTAVAVLLLSACGDDPAPMGPPAPPMLSAPERLFVFVVNQEIDPIEITNSGGSISACSVDPELPQGLSIEQNSCRISGMPTQAMPQVQVYTVAATNDSGGDNVRISFHINQVVALPIPELADELNIALSDDNPLPDNMVFTLPLGEQVLVSKFVRSIPSSPQPGTSFTDEQRREELQREISPNLQSGGILIVNRSTVEIASCAIEPELPMGLKLIENAYYCLIEGEPQMPAPRASYTITATSVVDENDENAVAQSEQVSLDILIPEDMPPPRLADRGNVRVYVASRRNLPIVFTNIGQPLNAEQVGAADPMDMRQPSCRITRIQCVDPSNNNDFSSIDLTMPGNWEAGLSATQDSCQLDIASSGMPSIPANADGSIPDQMDCRVRVTGLDASERGSNGLVLLSVRNSSPPATATAPSLAASASMSDDATPAAVSLRIGEATTNLPIELINSGGATTSCHIDTTDNKPDLPDGLEAIIVNPDASGSCAVGGVPAELQLLAGEYTMVGSNQSGSSRAVVRLSVQPVAPRFTGAVIPDPTGDGFTVPDTVQPVALNSGQELDLNLVNEGGVALRCRLIREFGSTSEFIHPNYSASLVAGGGACRIRGTAPAFTPAPGSATTVLTQIIYVELRNRHPIGSVYQLTIEVSPAP